MKYKNRLTFAYHGLIFLDFKSLQSVPGTLQLSNAKKVFLKMSKYRNTVFYNFKSRFLVIFSSNYMHRLVLKIPLPDHIFPTISKCRAENLHFPSTSKYYAPHPLFFITENEFKQTCSCVIWVGVVIHFPGLPKKLSFIFYIS